jgi:hypothetical protein
MKGIDQVTPNVVVVAASTGPPQISRPEVWRSRGLVYLVPGSRMLAGPVLELERQRAVQPPGSLPGGNGSHTV